MKFKVGGMFKNKHDCCDFMKILECDEETEYGIHLRVIFFTQLHTGAKQVSNENWIKILKKDYNKWSRYKVRGDLYEI
ncbi:hypothetical protein E6Q11_01675 [Candidatus Dojkabacteria bacterium]|uniref:Uncharacterized protein n=1 Tax=Candidatus Dojkabacteria bacterium TaxID=2099670 RepID=A0A5C7JAQ9_9BACT|nr:MAG: hypothetical protein E6Q11_01675 [Candidatus Dojkabacteria bacterium]